MKSPMEVTAFDGPAPWVLSGAWVETLRSKLHHGGEWLCSVPSTRKVLSFGVCAPGLLLGCMFFVCGFVVVVLF